MRGLVLGAGLVAGILTAAAAQDTVRVVGRYDPSVRPGIVVLPAPGLDSVRAILARDLDFSDRFEVITLPDGGDVGPGNGVTINYPLYKTLRASLAVELVGQSGNVTVRLHDLDAELVRHETAVAVDPSGVGEARMAVHRLADDIVQWTTGESGMAATRVLFLNNGDKRIYRIDSDGYGVVPITSPNVLVVSPVWSPDGSRFAYTQLGGQHPGPIILQSIATGTRVVVPTTDTDQNITPAFSPDGRKLVFSRMGEQASNLYAVNVADLCCAERLTAGRFAQNLSPAYSPDGRRIVFVSNRSGSPQIYAMTADGTDQDLLVPFDFGSTGSSYAPDWSPDGTAVVFHREYGGVPQIMTFDLASRQLRQRTSSGRNEDPSWAPDGRHVVFVSNRTGRGQLHVLDLETGRVRQLMTPGSARLPAWSRSLTRGR
jgi:TolB protein